MLGLIVVGVVVVGSGLVAGVAFSRRVRRKAADEWARVAAEHGLKLGPPGSRALRINLVDHKPNREFDNVMFDPESGHRVFRFSWLEAREVQTYHEDTGWDHSKRHTKHRYTCALVGLPFEAPLCTLTLKAWNEVAVECDDDRFVSEVITDSLRKGISTVPSFDSIRSAEPTIALQGSRFLAITGSLPIAQYPAFLEWTRAVRKQFPSEWL